MIRFSIITLVRQCWVGELQLSSFNQTNIALIPKVLAPLNPADFRPIRLCNGLYNIISKVLALRIKPVFPSLIDKKQGILSLPSLLWRKYAGN